MCVSVYVLAPTGDHLWQNIDLVATSSPHEDQTQALMQQVIIPDVPARVIRVEVVLELGCTK